MFVAGEADQRSVPRSDRDNPVPMHDSQHLHSAQPVPLRQRHGQGPVGTGNNERTL